MHGGATPVGGTSERSIPGLQIFPPRHSVIEDAMEASHLHLARRYSRTIAIALTFIGVGCALSAPADAQLAQQVDWCNGDDHATPDQVIRGCTALIQSNRFSGRDLAVAY